MQSPARSGVRNGPPAISSGGALTTVLAGWKLRCAKLAISARRKPLCGRPPPRKGGAAWNGALVDCGHMSGLCARHGWPLAQMGYADRVPNITAGSMPQRVSRGVPILGSTDRHLAAVLATPGQNALSALLGRKRPAIKLTAHHHGPERPSHLVGQRDCRKLFRLTR